MRLLFYLYFLFILISNFRLGRYIWYQSRDFNDFMGSLGSERIVMTCVSVVLSYYEIEI